MIEKHSPRASTISKRPQSYISIGLIGVLGLNSRKELDLDHTMGSNVPASIRRKLLQRIREKIVIISLKAA